MMKKKLLTGIALALSLSMGLASCGEESSSLAGGTGRIAPIIKIDGITVAGSITPESRANDDIHVTVTDLKLKLTSDDGSFSQEWESINDFDETQEFKTGDYTLEAYYGHEDDAEGYSKPHYHGSQPLSVKYDHTTDVALSASMKNARVKVRYTEAFIDYMTDYSTHIRTAKGKYISMPGDETSPVYVSPGNVAVDLHFTKHDGTNHTIEAASFDAKPKTEHVVTMDITGGDSGSDAILHISFDDTVETRNVEINLSDDLPDAPAPELTAEGWTTGQRFLLIENSAAPEHIKANIIAAGKIKSVILATTSPTLHAAGWPEEIDLADADAANQNLLSSLGLKTRGLWKNPDQMAVVDFTDVFPNLGLGLGMEESTHTFTLQVKDRYNQLSEQLNFTVVSAKGYIEIITASAEIGRKTIIAEVEYNGSSQDLSDVKFQKRNQLGSWDDLIIESVAPVAGKDGTYSVTLTAPTAIEISRNLKATFGSGESIKAFEVTTPEFELIASPNDAFAHRAIVTVHCEDADDALIARNLTFTLNGRAWDNYRVNGADVEFTNLRKTTDYTLVASSSNHTANASFTTENEEHLPGCNHPEDSDEHSCGFPTTSWHGVVAPGAYNGIWGACQYLWSVDGWDTLNKLTTSTAGSSATTRSAYKATSGTIPANSRSTHSDDDNGHDGHTNGEAHIHNDKQHSGDNAALIRTVGWGSNNTAVAWFGQCDHMTPGELYLGAYNNGPQYGVNHTARPSGLEFWYRYETVTENDDYGTAEITVYDANGVAIASGSIHLVPPTQNTSNTSHGYEKRTINLSYEKGAAKATKLEVIFRSTDKFREGNPALTENDNYWRTPVSANTSGGEFVGSELYIDDVKLIY